MKRLLNSGMKFPNEKADLKRHWPRAFFSILCLLGCLLLPESMPAQQIEIADSLVVVTDSTLIADVAPEMIPNQGFSLESFGRGVLGLSIVLAITFAFSARRRRINWKTVGIGLSIQLLLAIGVLKVPAVQWFFNLLCEFFNNILEFTLAGSTFVFGNLMDLENPNIGYVFAFQILPTIIFFSALTSVLYYLGVIQKVVKGLAWLLSRSLGISGPESLSISGNIFLGQTEAPLLIKAYLEKMNRSEILLVMVGGMATVAGGVLAAYIGFLGGNDPALRLEFARHLIAASVMAAPGAIVISKMLQPQTEAVDTEIRVTTDKIGSNLLDAIANGTTEGLKLAVNVGAMMLVFVAAMQMVNPGYLFGGNPPVEGLLAPLPGMVLFLIAASEPFAGDAPCAKGSGERNQGAVKPFAVKDEYFKRVGVWKINLNEWADDVE